MKLIPTSCSIKRFTHCKAIKSFIAELTELNFNVFQPLYDDAADVGFCVVNPDTGVKITVSFYNTVVDEGDVVSWVFTPTTESVLKNPKLEGYKFIIIND